MNATCTQRKRSGSPAEYSRNSPSTGYMPRTFRCIPRTRAHSRSAIAVSPNVTTVSHCVVPASRPNGSSSYRECCTTPASAPGCRACINSALTPPTSVGKDPCTVHAADPGPK